MRALDGAGRHAEALEVYGQARDAISEQLGVDPGAELRQLHAELLAKDSAPGGHHLGRHGHGAARGGRNLTRPASPRSPGPQRAAGRPGRGSRPGRTVPGAAARRRRRLHRPGRTGQTPVRPAGGRARARTAIRVRSASPWWPARAGWARPPWRCTRPTASAASSPTASCTSTCSARPRTRSRPGTCWPGSCVTSAWTAGTSRSTRPSARPGTGPRWPGAGCWSCSTTRATPPRSGRCCRAPRRPRCWSRPAAGCPTWPAPSWSTSTCSTTTRR